MSLSDHNEQSKYSLPGCLMKGSRRNIRSLFICCFWKNKKSSAGVSEEWTPVYDFLITVYFGSVTYPHSYWPFNDFSLFLIIKTLFWLWKHRSVQLNKEIRVEYKIRPTLNHSMFVLYSQNTDVSLNSLRHTQQGADTAGLIYCRADKDWFCAYHGSVVINNIYPKHSMGKIKVTINR